MISMDVFIHRTEHILMKIGGKSPRMYKLHELRKIFINVPYTVFLENGPKKSDA